MISENKNLPLVSVCIPAFNAEKTLSATLESILAQDYGNYEVIVSDNQSVDGTKGTIEKFAKRGVQYRLRTASVNDLPTNTPAYIGAYLNANFVLAQGRGEFLCLFHADDIYEPDIIRKQVAAMTSNLQVGAVFTCARLIGENGQPINQRSPGLPRELQGRESFGFGELFNAILRNGNYLAAPSVMLRRDAFRASGGFDEYRFRTSSDLEMWLRIARNYRIGVLDERLLNYRVSPKQHGAQYNKLRSTPADLFVVVDHFLEQPDVRALVKQSSLNCYELIRSNDRVFCAMNLLVQGKASEARIRLRGAIRPRQYIIACRRPRILARLILGAVINVSIYCGLEGVVCRFAYRAYESLIAWRNKAA